MLSLCNPPVVAPSQLQFQWLPQASDPADILNLTLISSNRNSPSNFNPSALSSSTSSLTYSITRTILLRKRSLYASASSDPPPATTVLHAHHLRCACGYVPTNSGGARVTRRAWNLKRHLMNCKRPQLFAFSCHLGHEKSTAQALLDHFQECLPRPGRPSRTKSTLSLTT